MAAQAFPAELTFPAHPPKLARMPDLPEEEFVTTTELAHAMGVDGEVVRKLIESGEVAATRPRHHYRIRREDALAAIERARERAR